ncbi:MAG TPA: hypothetical protein VGQ92_22445 [Actinoplanes sp.]|jgi:hypothetical protein|nr:hypothetical protein [Actinoplanes sp.]
MQVFSPGQVLTASDVMKWLQPRAAFKTANETINSDSTLSTDTDIQGIAVDANSMYRIDMFLDIESGTVPDFKFDLTLPASTVLRAICAVMGAADNGTRYTEADIQAVSCSGGTGGGSDRFTMSGYLYTAGTAGNVALRWAQNTLDAGGTTLKKGSHITLTKFG